MSTDRRNSASPPGPLSTYVERGSVLTALLVTALAACRPSTSSSSRDSSAEAQAQDTALIYENPIRSAFLGGYPELERMGEGSGVFLYPKDRTRVINKLRSELPRNHPLHSDEGTDMEDRVYAIVAIPGRAADSFYVIHTEGASGDPGFYFADGWTGSPGEVIWGEILAWPESGATMMYQRTNTIVPVVKELLVRRGGFEEVSVSRREIGLRTIVLDTIDLWRSPKDSAIVAKLVPGDSVVVVEAIGPVYGGNTPLLIQSSSGVRGWTLRGGNQCYSMTIRGVCFLGD